MLLSFSSYLKNFLNQQKKPIFDLFLGVFQKTLIKQHISRDFG